jgi:hypothetical protein
MRNKIISDNGEIIKVILAGPSIKFTSVLHTGKAQRELRHIRIKLSSFRSVMFMLFTPIPAFPVKGVRKGRFFGNIGI